MVMAPVRPLSSVLTAPGLSELTALIERDGVVAIPTETFYGLGVSPFSQTAVERIGRLKGRPDDKPILVLIAEPTTAASLAATVPPAALALMRRFWPGPLTIVLPARPTLPRPLTAGTGTIGVRQPDHAALRAVLAAVGPLTGTSANRSGAPPIQTAEAVRMALGEAVDLIVDGGATAGGLPSTVVSAVGPVRVLREGRLSRQAIAEALREIGMQMS